VRPTRQDLDRHRLSPRRTNDLQILVLHHPDGFPEGSLHNVEVAHHSLVVELGARRNDLEFVVMRVKFALGSLHPRHHVPRDELHR
jgi:hypothetical protein